MAGIVGALLFCLATILCECTAVAVVYKKAGSLFMERHAVRYIEWLFWFLQSAALCIPVYSSISSRKDNWLQFAAVVLASAVSISIIMFLISAFLIIGSFATMSLGMFNVVKRYGSQGEFQLLSPEHLSFQQNFYLIYLLALAICLGVLFSMIPTLARKGWLVLKNGGQDAKGWEITAPNMAIGSDPMCRIQCSPINEFASCHARIHCYGSDFAINDLGSPAGTYVNGVKVKKAQLRHGDKIRLGNHLFEFTTKEPEAGVLTNSNVQKVGSTVPSLAPLKVPQLACLVDSFGNRHVMAMGTHSIGRDRNCAVSLSWEPTVSMHHADIIIDSDSYMVADRNSSNGTKVNGVAVNQSAHLVDGDVIELGDVKLTFELARNAVPSLAHIS